MRLFNGFRNGCYRSAYRIAYPLADRWWKLHPHDSIALALWVNGRVLGVLHSYKEGRRLPGGATKRDELPLATTIRETREEVGLELEASQLRHVLTTQGSHGPRHLFEAELTVEPPLRIDMREIIHASFVPARTLIEGSQMIADYLKQREAAPYTPLVSDW